MKVPCEICTRSYSNAYKRYGGSGCNACALFFRRSLKKYKKFVCYGNDDACLRVASKLGSHCRKCRYRKCVQSGMSLYGKTAHASTSAAPPPPSTFTAPPPTMLPAQPQQPLQQQPMEQPQPQPQEPQPSPFLDEMFLFAETLNALLQTCQKFPGLLKLYYIAEIRSLYDIAAENLYQISVNSMDRIKFLVDILLKYPITFEELDIFCSICISKLKFSNLSQNEQSRITQLQTGAFKKLLTKNEMDEKRLLELFVLAEHCLEKFN